MKAVTVHLLGGPEVLQVENIDRPVPKGNEVLVKVHASSLNPVDAKSIEPNSRYSKSMHLPITPGLDLAGEVAAVGMDVTEFEEGDKVFGQASVLHMGSGAFAEYAVTSVDSLCLMPDNVNFVEAASIPLAASSAYEAIFQYMNLRKGQRVLIHGGSGGIGTFAIQMAKHVGAYVITTATGAGMSFVKRLGANEVIDYKNDFFEDDREKVDAVLDTVGGDTYKKSFPLIKPDGIIVSMLMQPDKALMKKHNVRAILEMTKINADVLSRVSELVEQGVIHTCIAETFVLEDTRKAYEAKDQRQILGKIAIQVDGKP
jgi:alcohol dehydrogenase